MAAHMKVIYQRTPTIGLEDVAVTTHDFGPDVDINQAQANAIAARFETFIGSFTSRWANNCKTLEYRFYNGYNGDGSPGAVDLTVAGGAVGTSSLPMLPPQCACSITEETRERRHWGRFYLPGFSNEQLADDGRFVNAMVDQVSTAAQVLYDGWFTDGFLPVVWTDLGGPGRVMIPVHSIRVDNVVDIIRRRRWDVTTYRQIKDLAQPPGP